VEVPARGDAGWVWEYDPRTRMVCFREPPESGAEIEIEYEEACREL
jgi:hypothetical protein